MVRKAAVADRFYPGDSRKLRALVRSLIPDSATRPALGVVAPHAGYVYSGAVAGETFSRIRVPDRVVILGPNHHGFGHPVAVYASGAWATPLGEVPVDAGFAARLLDNWPQAQVDETAHQFEHSLEVQVPFLQVRNPDVRIVPVCIGHLPLADLLQLGEGLAGVIAADAEPTLVVASSDMTHYEPGEVAREKDQRALDQVLRLDPEELYRTVRRDRISMCGVLPTVVLLAAARRLGLRSAELMRYGNSGDVTGDQREVVGYAGVALWSPDEG